MLSEDYDKTEKYIIKIIEDLNLKYNLEFTPGQIDNVIMQYTSQDKTFEEIKQSVDDRVNRYILDMLKQKEEIDRLKGEIKPIEKNNPYFGEVYKNYVIHILNMYEEINNSIIRRFLMSQL